MIFSQATGLDGTGYPTLRQNFTWILGDHPEVIAIIHGPFSIANCNRLPEGKSHGTSDYINPH